MVFNVKKIFRISSDKHGRKEQQTDTDSPSEDDVYSQRLRNGANPSNHRPWANGSSTSLWHPSRSKDGQQTQHLQQNQQSDGSSSRSVRKKASRIGRGGKDSGGYFTNMTTGAAASNAAEPKLDKLFEDLRNPSEDGKDDLGVESTMKYLAALGLNPESGEVFTALELVQAPSLGEITRKGFVDGWKTTGYTTTEEQAAYILSLLPLLRSDPAYFKKVYRYTFGAGKEPDQRSMSLENAIEFWRVLFTAPGPTWTTPSHDWTELWITFLQEKWTRSVNRDMWNQTLEFALKTLQDETLSFWNEDGAWPSVIDDFVAWCVEKGIAKKEDAMDTSA
ncbi:Scaffold-type E3 ligase [Sporothrix eucalyptigena]|uniref:Defective in cullin neddylation protein n=1 Tax=Sporothrix eucalyptigena TaxID=1812306 RepID=A0ABP0CGY9_9PEZI